MALLTDFGTVAGALGLLGTGISNIWGAHTAQKNNELAIDTYEYNKELNDNQMEREDTAIQRAMEDAKAAGLNPLSVLGQSATSGAGAQLSAPELKSPTFKSAAKDFIETVSEAKKEEDRQKTLDAALQKADDEHEAFLQSQALGEEQIKNLQLQNQQQTAESAIAQQTLQMRIDEYDLQNQKLLAEITKLQNQNQTEYTQQQLNQAEIEYKNSLTKQNEIETKLYSTYEPIERAYKLQQYSEEMAYLIQQREQSKGTYEMQQRISELEAQLKNITLSIMEHDLPMYLESNKTSNAKDSYDEAMQKWLGSLGMNLQSGVNKTILSMLPFIWKLVL